MTDIQTESNLVKHAQREMRILGCAEDDIADMCKVIQAFADIGMSGGQAIWHIALLPKLLQFQNLTPLTDEPTEWIEVGPNVWQNSRCSEAFSNDNGRSYYLLSEGGSDANPEPRHVSKMIKHD